jgi:hypothetical protein
VTDWAEYLGPHPFACVIIGDVRSGKTGLATEILEQYRTVADDDGVVPQPYMIAPRRVHAKYPEWMKRVEPKGITGSDIPTDAILFGDDFHMMFHARDWSSKEGRPITALVRERHHYNTSMLVTTQDARVIDINMLPLLSAYIIKKPTMLMRKFERSEIAPDVRKADNQIPEPTGPDDDSYKSYAYVVSNVSRTEEMVTDCGFAPWFDDEMSKAWRGKGQMIKTQRLQTKNLNIVFNTIKTIGKVFG